MSARNKAKNKLQRRVERKDRKATFDTLVPHLHYGATNRASRRRKATTIDANPNARWKGSRMFAQRHKNKAEGK